jgi:hypothetical protein
MHHPPPYAHRRRAGYARPAARFRRRSSRRSSGDVSVGTLFWVCVLVAGCVSLGSIGLGLSSPETAVTTEKSLQLGSATPKLNSIRTVEPAPTVTPAPAEPLPSELALHDRNAGDWPAPTVEPPLAEPRVREPRALPALPAVESIPVSSVTDGPSDPAVLLASREPTFGESPMIRTWKTLTLAALLTAVSPPPAPAGGTPAKDPNKEVLGKVDELRQTVEALSKKLDALSASPSSKDVLADLKRVETAVLGQIEKVDRALRTDIAEIKESQFKQKLELQMLNSKLKAFDEQLAELSDKVLKLRKQVASETPVPATGLERAAMDELRMRLGTIEKALAALQPLNIESARKSYSPPPPANGNLGRVLLTNLYNTSMLVTLNGQTYRVEPQKTVELRDMPAGAINYEVFADGWGVIRPLRTTMLLPNETLMITAK